MMDAIEALSTVNVMLKQATPETALDVVKTVTVSIDKYLTEVAKAQVVWREANHAEN